MFLTAVLRVTVERFSANVNVLKDIVCTKAEDGKEGGGAGRNKWTKVIRHGSTHVPRGRHGLLINMHFREE